MLITDACLTAKCEEGDVRLLGSYETQGILLVCTYKRWGPTCPNSEHKDTNAMTVCAQLGFTGGEK